MLPLPNTGSNVVSFFTSFCIVELATGPHILQPRLHKFPGRISKSIGEPYWFPVLRLGIMPNVSYELANLFRSLTPPLSSKSKHLLHIDGRLSSKKSCLIPVKYSLVQRFFKSSSVQSFTTLSISSVDIQHTRSPSLL